MTAALGARFDLPNLHSVLFYDFIITAELIMEISKAKLWCFRCGGSIERPVLFLASFVEDCPGRGGHCVLMKGSWRLLSL